MYAVTDGGTDREREGSDGLDRTPYGVRYGYAPELVPPAEVGDQYLCENCLHAGEEWWRKAFENIEKWGVQDVETLLLAAQEEQGELTQAVLEARDEDGEPARIQEERDDLAALMLQLQLALNKRVVETERDSR